MPPIVDDRPVLVVTPTYDRPRRIALLERCIATLRRVAGLLHAFPGPIWIYRAHGGETEFLERLVDIPHEIEILCDGGRRCYVWHDLPLGQSPWQAPAAYRLRRCAHFLVWRPARRLLAGRPHGSRR